MLGPLFFGLGRALAVLERLVDSVGGIDVRTGGSLAGLLFWVASSCLAAKGEAEAVVQDFFEAAAAGNADLAVEFHSSSAGYRLELANLIRTGGYADFLQNYEGISFDKSVAFTKSSSGSTISISGDMHSSGRPSVPLFVELIKEDGLWKIAGFNAGGQ